MKKYILVKEIMRQNFVLVDGILTVANAVELIKEKNARALIIDKRHNFDEFGLVLISDIAKKVIAKELALDRVNLYEIMTKPIVSILPTMNIKYCAKLFEQIKIHQAPVIENNKVLGMLTYTDIVFNALGKIQTNENDLIL